eukprot:11212368-Lingulodinium_polyedra.AAC.1
MDGTLLTPTARTILLLGARHLGGGNPAATRCVHARLRTEHCLRPLASNWATECKLALCMLVTDSHTPRLLAHG